MSRLRWLLLSGSGVPGSSFTGKGEIKSGVKKAGEKLKLL
jgi:hypothetical protein